MTCPRLSWRRKPARTHPAKRARTVEAWPYSAGWWPAGLDPLAQALIGLQRAQGGPENRPVYLGQVAPTDYVAGALAALGAIMILS